MCSRLVDIKRVGFGNRNACRRLVEAWRVGFYRRETCRSPAEAWRVHFVHRKMCRKPTVSVLTVDKRVGGLNRLGESVLAAEKTSVMHKVYILATAKCAGVLWRLSENPF